MPDDPSPTRGGPRYRWAVLLLVLAAAVAGGARLVATHRRAERWPAPVRTANAVGDSTCLGCHGDKASFETTAHRLTTRPPTRAAIVGSFRHGENVLRTVNKHVYFRMDEDAAGFHQTAVVGHPPDTTSRSERIAIVAGSGRRGQSFLYWIDDRLYQLPISWWSTLGTWINSPGPAYVDGRPNFDRPVAPRCLECHATYVEAVPGLTSVNRFVPSTAILGVTCERCHAGGLEHVRRERSFVLRHTSGPAIVNAARLTRERQMEACSQCHGGLGSPKVPSFSYVAGKPLADYIYFTPRSPDQAVDVHGNQAGGLSASKCYLSSQMTCLTCHDVHKTQRDVKQISETCLTCHKEQSCGLFAAQGHALRGRCVDCHMPLQPSSLIVSSLEGKQERAQIRNHWIRVYLDGRARGAAAEPPATESGASRAPASSPPPPPGLRGR